MKLSKSQKGEHPQPPEGQPIAEFYSNAVGINYSPYEFELSHMLMDSKGELKGAINIRLSPQTAKSLLEALGSQVAAYEEGIGEIALPSGKGR